MTKSLARPDPRNGVLIVDKPEGPTSHDVVARLRKVLGTRQIGHAGTLDPMATGVLVVAIGEATKLVPWLTNDDKEYATSICFGIATDTLDAQGAVTVRTEPPPALAEALRRLDRHESILPVLAEALDAERARTLQVPPAYSAIKIDGHRAHHLARKGEAPELAPREVAVMKLDVIGGSLAPFPRLDLSLRVTKGYFVRSLAHDLARSLGTVGHLVALRRTQSGAFGIGDAVVAGAAPEVLRAAIVPLDRAAAIALPSSTLTAEGVRAATHGQRVAPDQLRDGHPRPSAWLDEAGRLVAVGEIESDGGGRVLRGFPQ